MALLLIILDTMFRGVALVAIYFGGRYLIREARQGFPSLNDPNHSYAEAVHHYAVVGEWNHYSGKNGRGHFHEDCADKYLKEMLEGDPYFEVYPIERDTDLTCQYCKKPCGCDMDFNCYCEHYEQYK